MSVARQAALGLRSEVGLVGVPCDTALAGAAAARGLRLARWPLPPGIPEIVTLGTIVVGAGVARPWWRWLVAHAMGHHLLHAGNQFWLLGRAPWWVARQERQADAFAGWVLFGEEWPRVPVWELAEIGGVPAECVARWLDVASLSAGAADGDFRRQRARSVVGEVD